MERAESFKSQVDSAAEILGRVYSGNDDSDKAEAYQYNQLDQFLRCPETSRAFFVAWLSADWSVENDASEKVFEVLRNKDATMAEILAEILVKNLTMSSAMVIRHRRDGREDLAKGSQEVRERTRLVIERLSNDRNSALGNCLKNKSTELLAAIASVRAVDDKPMPFKDFLARWNYDGKQLDAMETSLNSLFEKSC